MVSLVSRSSTPALPVITIFSYISHLSLTSPSSISGHQRHCQTPLKPHESAASRSPTPKILCRAVRCRAIGTSTIGTHTAAQHFGCKYFLTAMHEGEKRIWTGLGPVESGNRGQEPSEDFRFIYCRQAFVQSPTGHPP